MRTVVAKKPGKTKAAPRRRAVQTIAPRRRKLAGAPIAARRRDDWVRKLDAFLTASWLQPFAWGKADADCCQFVCGAIAAMTGVNPGAALLGKYASEIQAKRVIAKHGGFDAMVEAIAAAHWFEEITLAAPAAVPCGRAGRGDFAIVDTPLGPALFLVDLTGRQLVGKTEPPTGRLPLSAGRRAWRVK